MPRASVLCQRQHDPELIVDDLDSGDNLIDAVGRAISSTSDVIKPAALTRVQVHKTKNRRFGGPERSLMI
jgi:hypothetical protein